MQPITSATVVATTARANDITLFASLELSKSKWVVTINSPGSEKFSKQVVEGGDGAGLLDLLSRPRAKAEQRYGVQIKAIVIEEAGLAWFWLRHQPDSALSRWFRARVGAAKGRVRRIAIVALARKLLVALWRYVTQGVVPEGAVFKAA